MGSEMALIEWNDKFLTGVSDIDVEHQELIILINSFYSALEDKADKKQLVKVLNDTYGEIYSHFVHEENLMEKYGYDQYQEHHEDHVNLLDDIRDITDEVESTDNFDEQKLKKKLNDWFCVHFGTHDARLHKLEKLINDSNADEGKISSFFSKFKI